MRRYLPGMLALLAIGGCELEQITLVDVDDVVVAEVYANLAADTDEHEVRAFLHRTVGSAVDLETGVAELILADVQVTLSDGTVMRLVNDTISKCIKSSPVESSGACFVSNAAEARALRPGDVLELRIDLANGGTLLGATRLPGDFDLDAIPAACRLEPNALLPIAWSRSEGAWAYINETSIRGLPEALEPEGIRVEDDPLYLLGLSVSDDDTETVFPSEFGVFNRFDLDQDLAVRLQGGLPEGVRAEVTITAVDRNYVNWARGGSFNPSGQVRVPSVRGDGTGVFGATVGRRFEIVVSSDPTVTPHCPGS